MEKIDKHKILADEILAYVGGKENIANIAHCVTRLRFNLKDESLVNESAIKALKGIMGCQFSSGQFQVIIGPAVEKVFAHVCEICGIREHEIVQEVLHDGVKKKHSLKSIGGAILQGISGSVIPVLPVFICAGILKMLAAVFGPPMLGWISAESGLFTVLAFAGDAGFYFLPVILGYTSAKQFKVNPVLGMLMGAILIHPVLIGIASNATTLDILGLPVTAVNYTSSVVPIIMIVWIMSYVERFFANVVPEMLQQMLVPLGTVLVMLPVGLCFIGPLGFILGGYISVFFLGIHEIFGPVGIGIIASMYTVLVFTGMHHALNITCIATMMTVGYDDVVFLAATASVFSGAGAALGFIIKAKKAEHKAVGVSGLTLQLVAGIGEPILYGILLPFKKPFIAQILGGFCGGLYMGIMGCRMYILAGSNILILTGFISADIMNLVNAVIGSVIALVVALVATMLLGFDEHKESQ